MKIGGQLKRMALEILGVDPSDAVDKFIGRLWYNSASEKIKYTDSGNAVREVVVAELAQTLTNKTLTSPTITGPTITGTVNAAASTTVNAGTSNSDTTVNLGTGSGANTINIGGSNSTINMTGTVNNQNVTNMNVTDKLITLNDGGAAASGTAVGVEVEENATATAYVKTSGDRNSWEIKAPNTNGILSLTPGASNDTVAMLAATQTLTNKTLTDAIVDNSLVMEEQGSTPANPSAGFKKVYIKSDGKLYGLNSSGTEAELGGGGGGGGINYIDNPDAETATTGWATYADAAATTPVNGTGGAATTTWTRTTSNPLRGVASFLLTKDAANRQGEGASYDFTIDDADKAKILSVSFDYEIASGTYADDDVLVYIYDVTNSALIQPAGYKLKNATIENKHTATFQTASNSTSYRLILHVSSTSAYRWIYH
jgi:hypothetical protein